ncbi:nucleotidyltransferase family protein [Cellulomonas hominis]
MARQGSYAGVRLALGRLCDQGVVIARRSGNGMLFSLNRAHLAFPALDAALSTFEPFDELVARLHDLVCAQHPPDGAGVTLAVFGSVARGEATTGSDLDLLLVVPDRWSADETDRLADDLRRDARDWTGNAVQVYSLTRSALGSAIQADDPIVTSWERDAVTVAGDDVRHLLRGRS